MSYLHCPTCRCAYDLRTEVSCPRCGVRAGAPTDPVDDVIVAAEQLARAVSRASAAQLARAQAELTVRDARRALPSPDALPTTPPSLLRAVRHALSPTPTPSDHASPVAPVASRSQQALVTTIALALLARARLPRPRLPRPSLRAWASAQLLPRVAAARALLAGS